MPLQDREWYRNYWRPQARLQATFWSTRRTLPKLIKTALRLVAVVVILGYAAAVFVHLTNGFKFGTSLAAGFQDARLAVTCPMSHQPLWQFIDRTRVEQNMLNEALTLGEHVYAEICSENLFPPSDWTATLGEPAAAQIDSSLSPAGAPHATATPIQGPSTAATALPMVAPTPMLTPIVNLSPATLSLAEMKTFLLDLINNDRGDQGLEPVAMGTNTAAQDHAEEMLGFSFLSHWGLGGLKPYMRYTQAGGQDYEAENVSGVSSPLIPGVFYRPIIPMDELKKTQEGWMESAGHRANVPNPWHKKVNLGIACSRYTCAAVEQFEGDYIEFEPPPVVLSGVLSVAGVVKRPLEFRQIDIWYDSPTQELSLGQLDRTKCYGLGERPVAFIREPAPSGSYYSSTSTTFTWDACPSPYDVPIETPRLKPGFTLPRIPLSGLTEVPWITAKSWAVNSQSFRVQADLSEVVDDHGPGVYTIIVWGISEGESVALTNYSIFLDQVEIQPVSP